MAAEQEPPVTEAKGEGRRGDGVVLVTQDNAAKALNIVRMNESAEELLGYSSGEAVGRRLETLLNPRMAEYLSEEIEYADDAPDLGDVLSKQRELRLRHRAGQEITAHTTVSRLMPVDGRALFQLVIPNERESLGRKQIRDFIALNLEGRKQLEPVLEIPNRDTALEFLPFLRNYLADGKIEACFAIIRMDRYEKSLARYGQSGCLHLMQHMANSCRASFRNEDIFFALSPQTLGIVLFDISRESARMVFNRLRWKIRNHHIEFGGKSSFSVTGTVVFDMIDAARGETILSRVEEAVAQVGKDERNGLIELGN